MRKLTSLLFSIILALLFMFLIEYLYIILSLNSIAGKLDINEVDEFVLSRAGTNFFERYTEGRDYLRNISYHYNQYGFRFNGSHQEIEPKGVVYIGDSLAEGQYLFNNETLSFFLGEQLGVNVYNLGLIGACLSTEFAILQHFFDIYEPRLVLWQWFLNDYSDFHREFRALNILVRKMPFFKEQIFGLVAPGILKRKPKGVWEVTESLFEEISEFSSSKNLTIIFLMYPWIDDGSNFDFGAYPSENILFFKEYYGVFRDLAISHNFTVLEINKIFPEYDYGSSVYSVIPNDPHPSVLSNMRLADYLSKVITVD